jgi:hypothetical protein
LAASLSQNLQADISVHFAPGALPPCVSGTLSSLESATFAEPQYLIDQPNAVVAKVDWTYQFKGSEEHHDGGLIFSVNTNADQLISEILVVHDNEKFNCRLPKPKPATVSGLVQEFFAGLSSLNLRDSLVHTHDDFTLNVRGDVALLPHHLETSVNRNTFAAFKDKYNEVFDFASKSLRCSLKSEDKDTSTSHCLLTGKYNRVKFCLDGIVIAEAKEGLLTSIDFYIGGACDPKAKFEEDAVREERLRLENEKKEALLREEERRIAKEKEDAERKALKEKEDAERKALKEKEDAEKKAQKSKKGEKKTN